MERRTSAVVDVAGMSILVEAASPADLDLVQRVVGSATAPGPPEARLAIGPHGPQVPGGPPDYSGPYGDHWDDGVTHSFRHHWGLTAVATASGAELGGPVDGYRRWVTVRNAMLFVLARLLFTRGHYLVHGAALRRGDGALLVVGGSGSGKSSLAFAAHRGGWTVCGDDMVAVSDDGTARWVRGIARVPSVPGDVAALAEVGGEPLPRDPRSRVELPDLPLDPRSVRVEGVVIADHDAGEGALEAVAPAKALEALVPALVQSALPGPVAEWFPVAARLARGPAVRLRHAAPADLRLDRAAELLDEAWA